MPVTLQDIQKEENGAGFLKADLHIHSYGGSADVKDRAMTAEAIIDAAVAQGISLLAITDHNSEEYPNEPPVRSKVCRTIVGVARCRGNHRSRSSSGIFCA